MTDDGPDAVIRQAIGGDDVAISWILAGADTADDAVVVTMAALLERDPARLARAEDLAVTSSGPTAGRDRARPPGWRRASWSTPWPGTTWSDYPGSLIVSWIASNPGLRDEPVGRT